MMAQKAAAVAGAVPAVTVVAAAVVVCIGRSVSAPVAAGGSAPHKKVAETVGVWAVAAIVAAVDAGAARIPSPESHSKLVKTPATNATPH